MENKIKYAVITEGKYNITEDYYNDILEYPIQWFMEWDCIDDDRNLYIIYNNEDFYENDSCDFQYIVKIKSIDTNNIKTADIIDLTDDDVDYIKKYHGLFFSIYSYWSQAPIIFAIKAGLIDINKWDNNVEIDYPERDKIIKKCLYKMLNRSIEIFGKNK